MTGRIHSFQSLGTVDGPGVRFVVFTQGCHLRCACCHNPDTWEMAGGKEYTPEEVLKKVLRCKSYFGPDGGVTLTGGEPLLQAEFCTELFRLCHENGVHTCLDTSGSIWNDAVSNLLKVTDRVLLDYKYADDIRYREHVGCSITPVQAFLEVLETRNIPTTLRQVIIPGISDSPEDILALKTVAKSHRVVDKVELLPFRTICQPKYDAMGIPFPLGHLSSPTREKMDQLNALLSF